MKKLLVSLFIILSLTVPAYAEGSHLDLGVDTGRVLALKDGGFTSAVVPNVTVLFGPITLTSASYVKAKDGSFLEQWTQAQWYSREGTTGRFTFFASGSYEKWPKGLIYPTGGGSWSGQVGTRYRIK